MKKIYFFEFFNNILKKYKINKLRKYGSKIGKIIIHGNFYIEGQYKNLQIDDNLNINEGVIIQAHEKINIGKNVHLSYGSKLITCNLDLYTQKHICKPIIISDNVWVGANAVILGGGYFGRI